MANPAAPVWDRWRLLASPMFAPLAPVIERLPEDHFPTLAELNRLCAEREVVSGGGGPLQFVPQEAKMGEPYEKRVFVYGNVLTRNGNWHDLFNALVWISFPKTKAAINRHHFREMQARKSGEARGPVRDVLTLFDESGVVIASSDASLSELITGFQWKNLFWNRREDVVRGMRFHLFGHALYEKALDPYKGVTGKSVIVDVSAAEFEWTLPQQLSSLDAQLARAFADMRGLNSTEDYAPLPILGVPGWIEDNASERYYEDTQQFRPGRAREREQPQQHRGDQAK